MNKPLFYQRVGQLFEVFLKAIPCGKSCLIIQKRKRKLEATIEVVLDSSVWWRFVLDEKMMIQLSEKQIPSYGKCITKEAEYQLRDKIVEGRGKNP